MLVVHLVPLRSAWLRLGLAPDDVSSGPAILQLLALSLAIVFFGFKVADVGWLRLKPGWQSAVSASLVAALLHVNVLDRATAGELAVPGTHFPMAYLVGTLVALEALRRKAQRFLLRSATSRPNPGDRLAVAFCGGAWGNADRLPYCLRPSSTWTPRGPPSF
jgi:hypothetical protein